MAKFSQQLIDEQYKKLPQELKDAIFSVDIADKIFEIGRKFAITIEKNGFLAEETAFVVLGLLKPEEFTVAIKSRLGVEDDEAHDIAKEVNRQILLPIREALKRAHQIEIPDEEAGDEKSRSQGDRGSSTKSGQEASTPEIMRAITEGSRTNEPKTASTKPIEPLAPKPPIPEIQPGHFLDKKELEDLKQELIVKKQEVRPVIEQKVVVPPIEARPSSNELIPPPPKSKLQPIDLRQGAKPRPIPPQFISGAIFVPPLKRSDEKIIPAPEPKITKEFSETPKLQDGSTPLTTGKKPIIKSFDPYRETAE